ncbi:hypothetical protein SOHN41_03675 [Shewanella sp. HN-41]|nr:hypothetical protein SOHN41_03675 [Shewanella sp. HN-41]
MPLTATYTPVLNPVNFRASCSIERPKAQCKDQSKHLNWYIF